MMLLHTNQLRTVTSRPAAVSVPPVTRRSVVRAPLRSGFRAEPRRLPLLCNNAVAEPKADCDCGPKAAGPHWQQALDLLDAKDKSKLFVVQIAPAVRVAISEPFGLPSGTITIGQIVTGLRQLGFDVVFDTLFGADLTIMEEGTELLHRLKDHLEGNPKNEEPLPMFTSCCPGWVELVEKSYPDMIPYLSSCKSPQMMLGAIIKNYFADVAGYAPQDVISCSVMPCTRKQGEADRPAGATTGLARDVDHVITTAELAKIFQDRGIDLPNLPESPLDNPIGEGSGAGQLFGTTGGVMEAAVRTVYELVTGQPMERINLTEVRGLDGIKEATLVLKPAPDSILGKWSGEGEGLPIRIAVANGLGNAKKLINNIKDGSAKYDFVEVMACPGGCISGGGQPRNPDKQIATKRQQSMYTIDERMTLRRSHDNVFIQQLYAKFLGKPGSHKAHDLLHTPYIPGGPAKQ